MPPSETKLTTSVAEKAGFVALGGTGGREDAGKADISRDRGQKPDVGDYIWELRNPDGGMLGVEFARGVSVACDVILAHSLPERVDVTVRDADDRVVAKGEGLTGDEPTPMARLHVRSGEVSRESVWPAEEDIGRLVILPGGEVATLLSWWNADDGSEWRWQVEFHNKR